jgi:ankyrin repeat protein
VFQSWEALPPDTATFTPDITPLILAAHRDNYEIIKILLDRGATLPMPHDVRSVHFLCIFGFASPARARSAFFHQQLLVNESVMRSCNRITHFYVHSVQATHTHNTPL